MPSHDSAPVARGVHTAIHGCSMSRALRARLLPNAIAWSQNVKARQMRRRTAKCRSSCRVVLDSLLRQSAQQPYFVPRSPVESARPGSTCCCFGTGGSCHYTSGTVNNKGEYAYDAV